MFDRIEASTYLVAAAVTEGNLKLKNVIPSIIKTEIDTLKRQVQKLMLKKMKSILLVIKILKE